MTLSALLLLALSAAAIALVARARSQQRRIRALQLLVQQVGTPLPGATPADGRPLAAAPGPEHAYREPADTQLFGVVAHELRSPIAAILGYEELLSEGLLGVVDERAREALTRIRSSARQLLTLTEGMQELSGREAPLVVAEPLDHGALLRGMCERAASEAEARRVLLDTARLPDAPVPGTGDPQAIDVMLDAACGAALKTSAGRSVQPMVAAAGERIVYRLLHTGLDPALLGHSAITSGAALRIRIAYGFAARLGGTLRIVPEDGADGTGIEIVLPRHVAAPQPDASGALGRA